MKQQHSLNAYSRNVFQSYVLKTKRQVESELSKLVDSLSTHNLHPQIEYALMSGGKRFRPLLVLLSAQSVGGNQEEVMPLALAFELMHTATLVHDDIIDQDETRRGMPALHAKWSVNDAILTGDALIALSIDLASAYGQKVIETVAQSSLELCDGEKMDITFSLETANEESYLKRITGKSASLFRASTHCGASAGGGTPSETKALSSFGENFGIAYQVKDDLLDLTSTYNEDLRDLRSGRITLPLIHAYNTSGPDLKDQIDSILQPLLSQNSALKKRNVDRLLGLLHETGSLEYCEKKVHEHLQQAVASISLLKSTRYKRYLVEMTKALRVLS